MLHRKHSWPGKRQLREPTFVHPEVFWDLGYLCKSHQVHTTMYAAISTQMNQMLKVMAVRHVLLWTAQGGLLAAEGPLSPQPPPNYRQAQRPTTQLPYSDTVKFELHATFLIDTLMLHVMLWWCHPNSPCLQQAGGCRPAWRSVAVAGWGRLGLALSCFGTPPIIFRRPHDVAIEALARLSAAILTIPDRRRAAGQIRSHWPRGWKQQIFGLLIWAAPAGLQQPRSGRRHPAGGGSCTPPPVLAGAVVEEWGIVGWWAELAWSVWVGVWWYGMGWNVWPWWRWTGVRWGAEGGRRGRTGQGVGWWHRWKACKLGENTTWPCPSSVDYVFICAPV